MSAIHWHYGTGLDGYGPEEPYTARDVRELASGVSDELARAAEYLDDTADSVASSGTVEDRAEAWDLSQLANIAHNRSLNTNTQRRESAPVFTGPNDTEKLAESLWHALNAAQGTRTGEHSHLSWWECAEDDCDTESED